MLITILISKRMNQDNRDYNTSTYDDPSNTTYVWYIAGVLVLLIVMALVITAITSAGGNNVAMLDDETEQRRVGSQMNTQPDTQREQSQAFGIGGGNVSVRDIIGDPETFEGNSVIITGSVDEILGNNALVLREGLLMSEITVFHSYQTLMSAIPRDISDGAEVEVQGEVWMFNRDDIQHRLGITFPDDMFANWDNDEPVIIAESVRMVERE